MKIKLQFTEDGSSLFTVANKYFDRRTAKLRLDKAREYYNGWSHSLNSYSRMPQGKYPYLGSPKYLKSVQQYYREIKNETS